MPTVKPLTLLVIPIILTACGGGSSGFVPPGPVFATGSGFPSAAETIGPVFPARMAVVSTEDGTTLSARRETYALTFTSSTTAELTTPAGTVVLVDSGGGEFSGTLDGRSYSLRSSGGGPAFGTTLEFINTASASDFQVGGALVGFETPQSHLESLQDLSTVATYSGNSTLFLSTLTMPSAGTSTINVDFGTGAVEGHVFQDPALTLNVVDGQVEANGFSGTLTFAAAPPGFTLASSDLDGFFYGADAVEAGGVFEGSGEASATPFEFSGLFYAVQP